MHKQKTNGHAPGEQPLVGFRLKRLEMLNWGTFHGKVHVIAPGLRWTLLIGENGSGKSTAVDAARTLLVPPRLLQSSYNDATRSTENRRSDRSRRSYVRGAWTTASKEESASAETKFLRDPGIQSILLAVFEDQAKGSVVTLGQVLWELNGKIDEVYAVAEGDKNIRDHMAGIEDLRDIRRRLQKNGFITPSPYSAYFEHFRRLLGIPGESTMEVFNQAIGVKEVEDLNKFIRRHMLEGSNIVEFIRSTLRPHYFELVECHKAIKTAESQIQALAPIAECHSRIETAKSERDDLQQLHENTPFFFDWKHRELLSQKTGEQRDEMALQSQQKATLEAIQESDNRKRDELNQSLARNETEIRIRELELQIKDLSHQANERRSKYNLLIEQLGVLGKTAVIETSNQFASIRQEMGVQLTTTEKSRSEARARAIKLEATKESAVSTRDAQQKELAHLAAQKALIPSDYVAVRQSLCAATKIPIHDLPFVGELIQVKQRYQNWTGVIERLMRGFGISLLVPEHCYDAVSRYINGQRIVDPYRPTHGIRLEFLRVPKQWDRSRSWVSNEKSVVARLEFQQQHALSSWLVNAVAQRFRHVCCDSIEHFQRELFAVTQEGLIRSGERHIKDDRKQISDPSDYVLGWSNREKSEAVLRQLNGTRELIKALEQRADAEAATETELQTHLTAIGTILSVQSFTEMDFRSVQRELNRLSQEKAELESSSEIRTTLKKQIASLESAMTERKTQLEDLTGQIAVLRGNITLNERKTDELNVALELRSESEAVATGTRLLALDINTEPMLDTIDNEKRLAQNSVQGHVSQRKATISTNETKLQGHISGFLRQFPEHGKDLGDSITYASEFVDLLERITAEELPKHQKRFEEFLGTNLVGNIATLRGRLSQEEKSIKQRIHGVNSALREIEFSAGTYPEIVLVQNRGEELARFKEQLSGCLSHTINPPAEERPRIFEQIRLLMQGFESDELWMRRVTDVRNWFDFGVRIKSRADDHEVEFFDKSSGKSPGQKVRLAFAILASAIASQYGLISTESSSSTFRLVIIDEAFALTDEANSQRALELFRTLGVQLIIVNPFDAKGRIVEDYVDSFHLAVNPDGKSSQLQSATRLQYESLQVESPFHVASTTNS